MLMLSWWREGQGDYSILVPPSYSQNSRRMRSLKLGQTIEKSNPCNGLITAGFLGEFYTPYTVKLQEAGYAMQFPKPI